MTERQILESTYFDRADVYRRANAKDPETKQMRQTEVLVISGLPCALSQVRSGSLTQGDGYGVTSISHVLFFAPDADLQAGDRLEVTTGAGQRFTLWAGRPFLYSSHGEVPLTGEAQA